MVKLVVLVRHPNELALDDIFVAFRSSELNFAVLGRSRNG